MKKVIWSFVVDFLVLLVCENKVSTNWIYHEKGTENCRYGLRHFWRGRKKFVFFVVFRKAFPMYIMFQSNITLSVTSVVYHLNCDTHYYHFTPGFQLFCFHFSVSALNSILVPPSSHHFCTRFLAENLKNLCKINEIREKTRSVWNYQQTTIRSHKKLWKKSKWHKSGTHGQQI